MANIVDKKIPLELKTLYQISESIRIGLSLQKVLGQIVEAVSNLTRPDSCLIYLLDEIKGELVLRASKRSHQKLLGRIKMKLGEGVTGWVAKQKMPVAISENASDDPRFKFFNNLPEDRYQAFLSVPIINREEVIGVINVQHKRAHQHSPDEITLLSTIAHQVGGAIEIARLYEETKRRGLQLEILAQISKTIASNRYLKEILQLIVTMTAEMMNSKICSVMFLDEKKQELTIEATQSLSQEYINKPPLKVGESISGKAVKEKRPVTVLDVTKDPGYKYPQIARKEDIR